MKVVLDEYGTEWTVMGGDPAIKDVRVLRKLGFDTIVLPRVYLINGVMPLVPPQAPNLTYGDTLPGGMTPFLLSARMSDCMKQLGEV